MLEQFFKLALLTAPTWWRFVRAPQSSSTSEWIDVMSHTVVNAAQPARSSFVRTPIPLTCCKLLQPCMISSVTVPNPDTLMMFLQPNKLTVLQLESTETSTRLEQFFKLAFLTAPMSRNLSRALQPSSRSVSTDVMSHTVLSAEQPLRSSFMRAPNLFTLCSRLQSLAINSMTAASPTTSTTLWQPERLTVWHLESTDTSKRLQQFFKLALRTVPTLRRSLRSLQLSSTIVSMDVMSHTVTNAEQPVRSSFLRAPSPLTLLGPHFWNPVVCASHPSPRALPPSTFSVASSWPTC